MTPTTDTDDQMIAALRTALEAIADRVSDEPPVLEIVRPADRRPRRWVPITAAAACVATFAGIAAWRIATTDEEPRTTAPIGEQSTVAPTTPAPTPTDPTDVPPTPPLTGPTTRRPADHIFDPDDLAAIDLSAFVGTFPVRDTGMSVVREAIGKTCFVLTEPSTGGTGSACTETDPHLSGFTLSVAGSTGDNGVEVKRHVTLATGSQFVRLTVFRDGDAVCDSVAKHPDGLPMVSAFECLLPPNALEVNYVLQLTDDAGEIWEQRDTFDIGPPATTFAGFVTDAAGAPFTGITKIEFRSPDSSSHGWTLANSDGAFSLSLSPGTWIVGPSADDPVEVTDRCTWPTLTVEPSEDPPQRTVTIVCA